MNEISVPDNSILFTDLYELTMGQRYFDMGLADKQASFEVFVRKFPKGRKAMIMAGLDEVAYMMNSAHSLFTPEVIAYLRGRSDLSKQFVDYLAEAPYGFSCGIVAFPQGRPFLENEPILRVTGPIIWAQLLETFILNALGFSISVATKARRIVEAAQGKSLSDFSPRRCQSMDAAMKVAKYSYMMGFDSTSNVLAGMRYGIPVTGTVAHSFITAMYCEHMAFGELLGRGVTTILLDSYDTRKAIKRLVKIPSSERLKAVRIDSGDLKVLSRYVRKVLDRVGRKDVKILASGDLDEYKITDLVTDKAPIDGFGVGTALGTCNDAPALGITYKLVSFMGRPKMKLSDGKETMPGPKQVFRSIEKGDTIGLWEEEIEGTTNMLEHAGYLDKLPSIDAIRDDVRRHLDFERVSKMKVVISPSLKALTDKCRAQIKVDNGL